jgi:hypothetical protein
MTFNDPAERMASVRRQMAEQNAKLPGSEHADKSLADMLATERAAAPQPVAPQPTTPGMPAPNPAQGSGSGEPPEPALHPLVEAAVRRGDLAAADLLQRSLSGRHGYRPGAV